MLHMWDTIVCTIKKDRIKKLEEMQSQDIHHLHVFIVFKH